MSLLNYQCNEKDILWSHVQKLYEADTASMCGIRLVPKLRYEHISLTSFSKMRVDLAAQVCFQSCMILHDILLLS